MKILLLKLISFSTFLFFSHSITAQIIVVSDTLNGWDQTWVANFNGAQASYDNWSEGGVNTISGTASTVYTKYYRNSRFSYGFRTHLRYGQSQINGNDLRKTDDLISIRNRVTYELSEGSIYSAYGAVQFKTQFADGYDYDKRVNGGDSLISKWFAPAYLIEGFGIEIKPNKDFSAEIGVGLKQTIVLDSRLHKQYRIEEGKNIRWEGGITFGAQYKQTIMENTQFITSVETFTNLLLTLSETDIFWANSISGRINKYLSAVFQFEIRYDDDFSNRIQFKQVFAAGIQISIF